MFLFNFILSLSFIKYIYNIFYNNNKNIDNESDQDSDEDIIESDSDSESVLEILNSLDIIDHQDIDINEENEKND